MALGFCESQLLCREGSVELHRSKSSQFSDLKKQDFSHFFLAPRGGAHVCVRVFPGESWGIMGENGSDSQELELLLGFTGNYPVKLDSGLRIAVPSKFREILEKKYTATASQVVVMPDDGKLKLLPVPVWNKVQKQLESVMDFDSSGDKLRTFIFGNIAICPLDAQNRIRLTPALCEMAELEKEVVVVGQQDRMELWSAAKWKQFNVGTAKNLAAVMADVFRNRQPRGND